MQVVTYIQFLGYCFHKSRVMSFKHLARWLSPCLLSTGQVVSEQEKISDGSCQCIHSNLRFPLNGHSLFSRWLPSPLYVRKGSQCISSPSLSKGSAKISSSSRTPEPGHLFHRPLGWSLRKKSEEFTAKEST